MRYVLVTTPKSLEKQQSLETQQSLEKQSQNKNTTTTDLSTLEKGQRVWYSKENCYVTIKKIFYDDKEPYYQIVFDGDTKREKQTIRKYLEVRTQT